MTKRDKLRRRLRQNPKGVRFQDVETLLSNFGFVRVRVSGSHHIFRYRDAERAFNFVVPVHGNTVKPVYIRDIIDLLDEIFPEGTESNVEGDTDADE